MLVFGGKFFACTEQRIHGGSLTSIFQNICWWQSWISISSFGEIKFRFNRLRIYVNEIAWIYWHMSKPQSEYVLTQLNISQCTNFTSWEYLYWSFEDKLLYFTCVICQGRNFKGYLIKKITFCDNIPLGTW